MAKEKKRMKRFIFVTLMAIALTAAAFAQGVTEVPQSSVIVDLSTGTSTSELVGASFNEDGNLELSYEGTESMDIVLSGTLNGTLIVKNDNADITLRLNNVSIKGKTLPAIQLKSETTVTLYSADGDNVIADSADNEKKGVITSSGSLIIDGSDSSTLTVEVYKKHGIKTDGGVTVNGGNTFIFGDEAAEGNMISADLYFIMNGGNLIIEANGNVHATESKGIKVNGVEGTGAGLGQVEINGGYLEIVSVGKAITAGWKLSEDATTEDTSDDPVPNVYINGGEIFIQTTGTPYEISDEESLSPEGIEAKNILYINGGTVYLFTTDDSLNATNSIVINGGYTYAASTDNDSIDSNGTIEINGGTVITMSNSMEQAFDCDSHTNFTYTGGTYVGAGNGNNMPGSDKTTAYSIAYGDTTFYAGDQIAVLDSAGNVVTGFVVPYDITSLTSIVFGSENFKAGETYSIVLGAYESQPVDGLAQAGATFKTREEVVTMDMTDYTVSEGYIGMDVGTDQMGGFGGGQMGQMPTDGTMPTDMGGFGGQMGQMPTDGTMPTDMGGFGGQMGGMGTQRGMMGAGFDYQSILQTLIQKAQEVELPEGVTLPEDLSTETAVQAVMYILANYIDYEELMQLVQGSIFNGEFDQTMTMPTGGQMPTGTAPNM